MLVTWPGFGFYIEAHPEKEGFETEIYLQKKINFMKNLCLPFYLLEGTFDNLS